MDVNLSLIREFKKCRTRETIALAKKFRQSRATRLRMVRIASRILRHPKAAWDDRARIGASRVLVAAIPETLKFLQSLLKKFSEPLDFEIHFSLFVALDDVQWLGVSKHQRKKWTIVVISMAEQYLMHVRTDQGYGAWKAGDTLGDHLRTSEGVEVLMKCATQARFVAGRSAAIHGLEHALNWVGPAKRKNIFSLLRQIGAKDRSNDIRFEASLASKGGGCVDRAVLSK